MIKTLSSLIGKTFSPHDLDEKAAKITNRKAFFDANGWSQAKDQKSFAYEKEPDNADGAYNIQFVVLKDAGEKDSLLKVTDVDRL